MTVSDLRTLLQAGTPGEWFVRDNILRATYGDSVIGLGSVMSEANATLLVALHNAAEALLAVVEAAQYLVRPSPDESPAEVCPSCGTYGVGELREALAHLAAGGTEGT